MGQVNFLQTNTPQTPSSGRKGIFVDLAGDVKTIDDGGNIAGFASPQIIPATERESNTVLFDKDYIKHQKLVNKYKDYRNTVEVCVRSFEQRKDLLQTLAANYRGENK